MGASRMIRQGALGRSLHALLAVALLAAAQAAVAGPDIQRWQLDNGVKVHFVAAPELPMVDARLVFDAGSARDGERYGLALMTNGLLVEGTAGKDADAVARGFERLGARYDAQALRDMAIVSLRSLNDAEYLQPAADLLADLVRAPSFPQESLERDRRNVLVALARKQQVPGEIAKDAFYAGLYGEHPYAHPSLGKPATVQALTREDVQDFHQRLYVGNNAILAIVGDLDRAGAEALAERLAGGLPAGEPAPALPAVQWPRQGMEQVERIQHPSEQAHLLLGMPALTRDHPDYFPLYVGNHVLGGSGLVSNISDAIREQRGLAYSAYSYFAPMRRKGPFIVGMQTRGDQADEAVTVLSEVIGDFIAEGPSAQRLEASKKNIVGGFPLRLDSNSSILEYVAMMGFYDLPADYLDTFVERVQAVTAEQIQAAFQRAVDPAQLYRVHVGGGTEAAP